MRLCGRGIRRFTRRGTARRPSGMEADRRHQQPAQALPGERPSRL